MQPWKTDTLAQAYLETDAPRLRLFFDAAGPKFRELRA
jgi:hypothetical protein